MLGLWVRPWPGEFLVGQIVAISGDHLECRSPGGVQFSIRMADVRAGKIKPAMSIEVSQDEADTMLLSQKNRLMAARNALVVVPKVANL